MQLLCPATSPRRRFVCSLPSSVAPKEDKDANREALITAFLCAPVAVPRYFASKVAPQKRHALRPSHCTRQRAAGRQRGSRACQSCSPVLVAELYLGRDRLIFAVSPWDYFACYALVLAPAVTFLLCSCSCWGVGCYSVLSRVWFAGILSLSSL